MRTESWTNHTAHPRRCLYSIGLSPPNDRLMRLQLYQLIESSSSWAKSSGETPIHECP